MNEDVAAAVGRLQAKVGVGRELKHLHEYLFEGERVLELAAGQYAKGQGLLVLSDQRLLFVLHGVMQRATEDFRLDRVASVEWSSWMIFGTVTIWASGAACRIENVQKVDGKRLVDAARQVLAAAQQPQYAPPQQQQSVADPMAAMAQLKQLFDAGMITGQEFEAKRQQILSRM